MHRVILLCVALACTLVYEVRTEASDDLSPDLPYAETVDKERALDDMVDELLMGLLEEEKELPAERAIVEKKYIDMLVLGHITSGADSTLDSLMAKLGARRDGRTNLWQFETTRYVVDVLEGPGSTEFMPNMLKRARPVDFAVLFVRASTGDFEADVAASGLTRQHASLAHKLSITRLAVAVNKMDITEPMFSQPRFLEVKLEMMRLLYTVGFDPETVAFVPIALPDADNIMQTSSRILWYRGWSVERKADTIKGTTLGEAVDALTSCTPPYDKPLRVPITGAGKRPGLGVWPQGRVEYGVLRPGMKVTFAPGGLESGITEIERDYEEVLADPNGPYTNFRVSSVATRELKKGMLMGDSNNDPPKEAVDFKALVLIVNPPGEIRVGNAAFTTCHTAHGPCRFEEIHEKIDSVTGTTIEVNPQALKAGDVALVTLKPLYRFSVEAFSDYPSLGRFTMREYKSLIAVGRIQSVVKKDDVGTISA